MKIDCNKPPFLCEWVDAETQAKCGKTFNQKGNLIQHLRMHNGEKPFFCNLCDKSFSASSNRNDHMRRHNKNK